MLLYGQFRVETKADEEQDGVDGLIVKLSASMNEPRSVSFTSCDQITCASLAAS